MPLQSTGATISIDDVNENFNTKESDLLIKNQINECDITYRNRSNGLIEIREEEIEKNKRMGRVSY